MLWTIHKAINDRIIDRKAIREAEASLTPGELEMFRKTKTVQPWRDAYRVIMQERVYNANSGPERARSEVQAAFDQAIDRIALR